MHYLGLNGRPIAVELVSETPMPKPARAGMAARPSFAAPPDQAPSTGAAVVLRAAVAHFKAIDPTAAPAGLPALPLLREQVTGTLKTMYREIMLRVTPGTSDATLNRMLAGSGLEIRRRSPLASGQVVVADRRRQRYGMDLLDLANTLAENDEVLFATPNFVSQYRRTALPAIPAAQWFLHDGGPMGQAGQAGPAAGGGGAAAGQDVRVQEAWAVTTGRRNQVVAVLDDGVDIDHPNLRRAIWRNPDRTSPDRFGRDFVVPDDNPDHWNPRPKRFTLPFDSVDGNDIHGTPCAGLVVAQGADAVGVAPGCRLLAVKIFHASDLAPDEAVANAVRYAARTASVLSCSWTGPDTPDLAAAVADVGAERGGRGAVVVAATGNDSGAAVGAPARFAGAIGVGACTDAARVARYSNVGPEVSVVAPSSGGRRSIYTTDVGIDGRGYEPDPRPAGLHTGTFGGTSAATPIVAGIAALMLSANPDLDRAAVHDLLQSTATRIGTGYGPDGHSDKFGHGRVDAGAAVHAAAAVAKRKPAPAVPPAAAPGP